MGGAKHTTILTPSPSENVIYSYVQGNPTTGALHATPSPLFLAQAPPQCFLAPLSSQPFTSGSLSTAVSGLCLWRERRSPLILPLLLQLLHLPCQVRQVNRLPFLPSLPPLAHCNRAPRCPTPKNILPMVLGTS